MDPFILLALVIVTALAFDFTNGFHDTANAMATSIATGALKPKVAVTLSAVLNLVGAFLSIEVALTVTNAVVKIQDSTGAPDPALLEGGGSALLLIVLAGLIGGMLLPAPARASSDYSCSPTWKLDQPRFTGCDSMAMLAPGNDTRVNLALLLATAPPPPPIWARFP